MQTKGHGFPSLHSAEITGPSASSSEKPRAWRKANKFSKPYRISDSKWPVASIVKSAQKAAPAPSHGLCSWEEIVVTSISASAKARGPGVQAVFSTTLVLVKMLLNYV